MLLPMHRDGADTELGAAMQDDSTMKSLRCLYVAHLALLIVCGPCIAMRNFVTCHMNQTHAPGTNMCSDWAVQRQPWCAVVVFGAFLFVSSHLQRLHGSALYRGDMTEEEADVVGSSGGGYLPVHTHDDEA